MAYSTYANLTGSEFTTAATHLGNVIVSAFIVRADAEIDSVLRAARYKTPITGTVPAVINSLSILKVGLYCEEQLYEHSDNEAAGDYISDLRSAIDGIENSIKNGKISFKLPRIVMEITSTGDSLTTPEVSQFKIESGLVLNTADLND